MDRTFPFLIASSDRHPRATDELRAGATCATENVDRAAGLDRCIASTNNLISRALECEDLVSVRLSSFQVSVATTIAVSIYGFWLPSGWLPLNYVDRQVIFSFSIGPTGLKLSDTQLGLLSGSFLGLRNIEPIYSFLVTIWPPATHLLSLIVVSGDLGYGLRRGFFD
jgi:hypothetical protein